MILTDEEVDERLNSPNNLVNSLKERLEKVGRSPAVLPLPNGGRTPGTGNVPPLVRELIGGLVNQGETGVSVAETFGVSQPVASGAARGLVDDRFDSGLAAQVKTRTNTAHSEALDMLLLSMKGLKPKLERALIDDSVKMKDLSRVVGDMSKVVASLKPTEKDSGVVNNTQVILFAPPQKKESDYEFIEA